LIARAKAKAKPPKPRKRKARASPVPVPSPVPAPTRARKAKPSPVFLAGVKAVRGGKLYDARFGKRMKGEGPVAEQSADAGLKNNRSESAPLKSLSPMIESRRRLTR